MSTQLKLKAEFSAGVYLCDQLTINRYHLEIDLTTISDDDELISTALERMRTFVNLVLNDSIVIDRDQCEQIQLMEHLGFKLVTLPGEPLDHMIASMLFIKLNAICEDHVIIDRLCAGNWGKTQLGYVVVPDDHLGLFEENGWWNHASPLHVDTDPAQSISTLLVPNWEEYGLEWPNAHGGEIVPFVRHDD